MSVLLIAHVAMAKAQVSSELGFTMGTSNYLGDLQAADYSYRNPHMLSGVYGRYNANAQLAFRGFLTMVASRGVIKIQASKISFAVTLASAPIS